MSDKSRVNESAARGQTLRTEFGRDRSDDWGMSDEAKSGRDMKGGDSDISHSISNGKVPKL